MPTNHSSLPADDCRQTIHYEFSANRRELFLAAHKMRMTLHMHLTQH